MCMYARTNAHVHIHIGHCDSSRIWILSSLVETVVNARYNYSYTLPCVFLMYACTHLRIGVNDTGVVELSFTIFTNFVQTATHVSLHWVEKQLCFMSIIHGHSGDSGPGRRACSWFGAFGTCGGKIHLCQRCLRTYWHGRGEQGVHLNRIRRNHTFWNRDDWCHGHVHTHHRKGIV